MATTINVLVVGECGDGKSTMIDALREPAFSFKPGVGLNPKGVTKDLALYPCPDLGSAKFNIIDTPGIGDHDVPIVPWLTMLETCLSPDMIPGGIRGIIVTNPVPDGRIRLGQQLVQQIVDLGFVAPPGTDKYNSIILVGTKKDKADRDERESFMQGLDGHPSVRELFFQGSPSGTGPCVMVSRGDYSPMIEAIRQLPASIITYRRPEPAVLAEALAGKFGLAVSQQDLREQLIQMREVFHGFQEDMRQLFHMVQQESADQQQALERGSAALQGLFLRMKADEERAERAREHHKVEMEELRIEVEKEKLLLEERLAQERDAAQQRMAEAQVAADSIDIQSRHRVLQLERQSAEAIARARDGANVRWEMARGLDALKHLGEDLAAGQHSKELIRERILAAVTAFQRAKHIANLKADNCQSCLAESVKEQGRLQQSLESKQAQVRENREKLQLSNDMQDTEGQNIKELKVKMQETEVQRQQAEADAEEARKKHRDMLIGGSIAMVVPVFGWIAGGTTIAVAETAVKTAQIVAASAARHCAYLSTHYKRMLQEHEKRLVTLKSKSLEEDARLRAYEDEVSQLKLQITAQTHSTQEAQRLVEQTSDLWQVVTDVFHSADAARQFTEGPAFKLQLLREPILAIAHAEAWEGLTQHPLVAQGGGAMQCLENISNLLNVHCSSAQGSPISPEDIGNLI